MLVRTLPSINTGDDQRLGNIDTKNRIIIQEKIDGSQLTIFLKDGELIFYNKNKQINPRGKPFVKAWLSLHDKKHLFKEGLFYHGEAMTGKRTITQEYGRIPRYNWIIYEIVKSDNTVLTPGEMEEVLRDTNFETVQLLYDNRDLEVNISDNLISQIKRGEMPSVLQALADSQTVEFNIIDKVNEIMNQVENGEILSCLSGSKESVKMEGIVVKVLNRENKGKKSTTRYKFVRKEYKEVHCKKKEKIKEVSDEDFINELGEIYNTDARKVKAVQHMREKEIWKEENFEKNIGKMVTELDEDLLKEHIEDIKTMLLVRYWDKISKVARGDLKTFLQNL